MANPNTLMSWIVKILAGATSKHTTTHNEWFDELKPLVHQVSILIGNNSFVYVDRIETDDHALVK